MSTPTRSCSSPGTSANGMRTPSRATCRRRVGVREPGSSPSSSSRGEKRLSTCGTDGVAALQSDCLAVVGTQAALFPRPMPKRSTALRTGWTISGWCCPQVRRSAGPCCILQHPGTHIAEPFVQSRLDLRQRGFRVLHPPFSHAANRLNAQLPPSFFQPFIPHPRLSRC